jgi:hypothetical protein
VKEDTLVLPTLSPVGDKPISAVIADRCTSADGGLLLFQDVERRLNLADRLAACLQDPRQPGKITHRLDEILRFRMLAIVAGYPDGNDCDVLRGDPVFKMALDRSPVLGPALCSQPTISRVENMPRRPELYRMAQAMLDLYCDSFPIVPSHLTLDLDESFDRVHGEQELRKFNAYYDDWGFLPIHIFDTSGRLVVSVLREAATPSGREILALVKRVVGHLRERFPRVRIRLRGDSHYACPEGMTLRSLCDRVQRTRKRGCAAGVRRRVSSTSSAWPEPLPWRRGSRRSKPARRRDMPRAARPSHLGSSCAATRTSGVGPSPGNASAGSSPGSKPDPTGSTPATSSPT